MSIAGVYHSMGIVIVVIVWLLDLQLHMQSVPITINIVSLNPAHGEVYSIQHYVIKFVSDLRQVGCFLRLPPPIKLTATI
jgi:hypothetical protein